METHDDLRQMLAKPEVVVPRTVSETPVLMNVYIHADRRGGRPQIGLGGAPSQTTGGGHHRATPDSGPLTPPHSGQKGTLRSPAASVRPPTGD